MKLLIDPAHTEAGSRQILNGSLGLFKVGASKAGLRFWGWSLAS